MFFKFGKVTVDIDVEGTRNYFNQIDMINDCSCSGCRNYRKYTEICDDKIKDFFATIGIEDMNCIAEIMPIGAPRESYEKDRCMYYMGFYRVKGKLSGTKKAKLDKTWVDITQNFKVGVRDAMDLLPAGFPAPSLQIEISAYIPWVLEEENEYIV